MNNTIHQLSLILFAVLCSSCNNTATQRHHASKADRPVSVSAKGKDACSPYLTKDQNGNAVLCWTERLADEESFVLKYAVYDTGQKAFEKPVTVAPSKGTGPNAESMNKVAFKSDGTAVAVYAKKHPTRKNPFAGSLFYSQSSDEGKTWSAARYLHSDTLHTYGRSFFDLAILPDGEVGAIWLDGRFGEADKGSALFFAKTGKGKTKGFGSDKQIGESTCECCRTELYVGRSGRINVAYRDIIGDNIRDIAYQFSVDNGETFSQAQRISRDNWEINGCPHTGPSLAENGAGLHALWFTAGGGAGVYHSLLGKDQQSFRGRETISEKARHPQLIVLPKGKLATVWDESTVEDQPLKNHAGHSPPAHQSGGGSKIMLQVFAENAATQTNVATLTPAILAQVLTDPGVKATHPVVETLGENSVLVAWQQRDAGRSAIYFKQVVLREQ